MGFLFRWVKRIVIALILIIVLLLLPVGYVELACQRPAVDSSYDPIIQNTEWQRDESRTLTTYPEWHIVHAYDDYAEVIRTGDPHDFGYIKAVAGFWTSLCPLVEKSADLGGFSGESKMTIYTIGVSFTAELLAKAVYEETVGRITTMLRGAERSALDDVSAQQAAKYANFLQQTPWYKWNFGEDIKRLENEGVSSLRDSERRFALKAEFSAKLLYAKAIANAVAATGEDQTRIRFVVANLSAARLAGLSNKEIVSVTSDYAVLEADRYRLFTHLAEEIALADGDFIEIAGNDEILFTALSSEAAHPDALYSFPRQGYADHRHLIVVPVASLADRLRNMGTLTLEHIHDY